MLKGCRQSQHRRGFEDPCPLFGAYRCFLLWRSRSVISRLGRDKRIDIDPDEALGLTGNRNGQSTVFCIGAATRLQKTKFHFVGDNSGWRSEKTDS
jgi:hypothetical protein